MYETVRKPLRPALPVSLYAAIACILLERYIMGGGDSCKVIIPLLLILAFAWIWTIALSRANDDAISFWRGTAVMATCAFFASVVAMAAASDVQDAARMLGSSSVSRWSFTIEGDPSETLQGELRYQARALDNDGHNVRVWLTCKKQLLRGDRICGVGRFDAAEQDDDWGLSTLRQGIAGSVRLVHIQDHQHAQGVIYLLSSLRQQAVDGIMEQDEGPAGALACAMIFGQRQPLAEQGIDELFAECGVAHLVAVSGSHLAIINALAAIVLKRFRLNVIPRLAVTVLLSAAFVVLAGAPLSAIRSWLMSLAACTSVIAGRRSHALSAVSATAIVMCLIDPAVSGQLGFLLSVASVCGICLLGPYVTYLLNTLVLGVFSSHIRVGSLAEQLQHLQELICESLGISLAAQLSTLPISIWAFSRVSLIGPLSTLATAPLFPLELALALLWSLLLSVPVLSWIMGFCCHMIGTAFLDVLHLLHQLPLISLEMGEHEALISLACVSVIVMLLVRWPDLDSGHLRLWMAGCCLALFVLIICGQFFSPACMTVLDVGQGDAILIRDGSAAILVDTGPEGSCAQALARNHVIHLDAIVLTHLHDDHYGGLAELCGSVLCDHVYVADGAQENIPDALAEGIDGFGLKAEQLSYGDELQVGGFRLQVISPATSVEGTTNEDSLEFMVDYEQRGHRFEALLTGDAESSVTESAMRRANVGDIDVLKVGHHGSAASITADELNTLKPELSIASAGKGNSYGHPTPECISVLEAAGSRFLCTIDVGDIKVYPSSQGVDVSLQKTNAALADVA